jgi:hypothetical protein
MDAFEPLTATLLGTAPAAGLPVAPLTFPALGTALAWGLGGGLVASALALAAPIEAPRLWIHRRVHAVRAAALRLVPPRRSRAGGCNDRVPPRSAAGSPPI